MIENRPEWTMNILAAFSIEKNRSVAPIACIFNMKTNFMTTYYRKNTLKFRQGSSLVRVIQFQEYLILPTTKQFKDRVGLVDPHVFSPTAFSQQLKRLLDSQEFHATDAQRAFLLYVIEKTLAHQVEII